MKENMRNKESIKMVPSIERASKMISTSANYRRVKSYLDKHDWHYSCQDSSNKGRRILSGFVGTGKGLFTTFSFTLWVENDIIQSFSTLPFSIPENKRVKAAELIVRLNYLLKCGAFELDFSDGEVRYRVIRSGISLMYDGDEVMRYLLTLPIMMIKHYVEAFFELVQTDKSVEKVFKKFS